MSGHPGLTARHAVPGYLAARVAASTPDVDPEVKAAAERAEAAGRRVGDSIRDHGWRLMTVDEHNPYDTLVVAGPSGPTARPRPRTWAACPIGYARLRGDGALLEATRLSLGHMTGLLRRYADIIYTTIAPERRVERHYDAALFDAQAGLPVDLAELDGFARAEAQISNLEGRGRGGRRVDAWWSSRAP